jgi:uncharacterized membrane protein (UPF0127 family)
MRYLIFLILIFVFGGLATFILAHKNTFPKSEYKKATVAINGIDFSVDVADTPIKIAKGLAGRGTIKPNEGMLFTFRSPSFKTFWMRNMLVPIDIIWVRDNQVVGVEADVPPQPGALLGQLRRYRSPVPVDYVLEVAAGRAREASIQTGSGVNIRP